MEPSAPTIDPARVAELSAREVDDLLTRLEASVPRRPPLVTLGPEGPTEAVVFGDSHGDWRSTRLLEERISSEGGGVALIGLGDYIDRAPPDSPGGSPANALFLLSLSARFPDRVYLLKGNHELVRRLGVLPHTLPKELERLWGPDRTRYDRLLALLERGPLCARTASGAFLAHAGFPRGASPVAETLSKGPEAESVLLDVTWSEPDAVRNTRGIVPPWGEAELGRFLASNGLPVLLRGHDPELTGRPLYGDRCLTLHTCRLYEHHYGVVVARVPLARPIRSVRELGLEHLATEGRTF